MNALAESLTHLAPEPALGLDALITSAPGLLAQLKSLGLDTAQVLETSAALGRQLVRGVAAGEVADLLARLDVQGFIKELNVAQLTACVGIDAAQARSFIYVIAPFVQAYRGEKNRAGLLEE